MKQIILIFSMQILTVIANLSAAESLDTLSKNYFADFYVSATGNNSWSGKLAEPNADKTDGPFATIEKAKQAVRIIKRGLYRNIYVLIRGGEHKLQETVIFTPEDSHYDSYSIVYMAYPAEQPVFSSDVLISGWELTKSIKGLPAIANGKVYAVRLPKLMNGNERFYTMYDEGKLLTRARSLGFSPTKSLKGGDDVGKR